MYPSLFWVKRWISRNGYGLRKNSERPDVFILGEYHHNDEIKVQRTRLIKRIKPPYYLSEPSGLDVGSKVIYVPDGMELPDEIKQDLIEDDKQETLDPIALKEDLGCIRGLNSILVGCDIDYQAASNLGIGILQKKYSLSEEDARRNYERNYDWNAYFASRDLRPDREEIMAETINCYVTIASSPLIVRLGAGHIEDDSVLYDHLDPKVKFWAIDQTGRYLPKPI